MISSKKQNYIWYIDDNWVMFVSALLTYTIRIIYSQIKAKYVFSKNTNKQFKPDGIPISSFKLQNGVVSSLLMYLI